MKKIPPDERDRMRLLGLADDDWTRCVQWWNMLSPKDKGEVVQYVTSMIKMGEAMNKAGDPNFFCIHAVGKLANVSLCRLETGEGQ